MIYSLLPYPRIRYCNVYKGLCYHFALNRKKYQLFARPQMSLYREAERERRKRRKRNGGKKSSLSAALSASLTALFTGGKSTGRPGDNADYDCYYGTTAADRIEYVTVRGCTPGRDDDDDEWWSSGDETGLDDVSLSSDAYNSTKGLAQMAVALGKFVARVYFSRNRSVPNISRRIATLMVATNAILYSSPFPRPK